MATSLTAFTLVVTLLLPGLTLGATKPHLIVIVADDLGWNDVGWRDSTVYTPVLDDMVSKGVELTNHYVQPLCSPSRAAFLSGKYPFKMGMQDSVLASKRNASLPLGLLVLPERLQTLGYSTHLVGKWHLGFCSWDMTPTYRGFDSFYGLYNGQGGHYDHISARGYDMHNNTEVDWSASGVYSTTLLTDKAINVLQAHDPAASPLFLMLSYQAVHTPNEVPDQYLDYCNDTADDLRRVHCAMAAAMDEGIGEVKDALTSLGYDDNMLILFLSDNGGQPNNGASNWPLRGAKATLWEGGTKSASFLYGSSSLLPNAPSTWDGLIHAVDWFPTLLRAAGDTSGVSDIDGLDLWNRIKNNARSERSEMVYNINEVVDNAAIRSGKFKLVVNSPGSLSGWYYPNGNETVPTESTGPTPAYQLFDLTADPSETTDVSDKNTITRNKVTELLARIEELKVDLVPSVEGELFASSDPATSAEPGAWYPGWC